MMIMMHDAARCWLASSGWARGGCRRMISRSACPCARALCGPGAVVVKALPRRAAVRRCGDGSSGLGGTRKRTRGIRAPPRPSDPRRLTRATLASSAPPLSSPVTDRDVEVFRSILQRPGPGDEGAGGKGGLVRRDDPDALEPYNRDWTGHYRGDASLVLLPASTPQVSEILRHCHGRKLAVAAQGGNTGLVGGSVAGRGVPVVLSTRRLNRIASMDGDEGILRCQAGCVLQDLQDRASASGWLVPLDLGSKGTCQIGGNLSTNAGGVYYYRYGSLAANLLGMTAVLADGRVLELGSSRVRKDNTGYKLQNLLLGAEGTLGIVTEVAMQCHPLPSSRQAAWLACPNFEGVLAVRRAARSMLGEVLAAMEWMDGPILDVVLRHQPALRSPVASTSPSFSHHVLVETHGSNENHDAEKMEAFLERVLQSDWAADGALARSVEHLAAFWKLREGCNPAMAAGGYTYKYDVSIPTAQFGEFVDAVEHRVREFFGSQGGGRSGASSSVGQEGEGGVVVAGWGHILDGNLHLNVHRKGRRQPDPDVASFLDRLVYEGVISRGGSISAEHGVGVAKKAWVPRVHSAATLETMRDVKRLFDPDYILNPGKIF